SDSRPLRLARQVPAPLVRHAVGLPVRRPVGGAEGEVADRLVLGRTVHVDDAARDDDDAALRHALPLLAGEPDEAAAAGEVEDLLARVRVRSCVSPRVEMDGEELELVGAAG